MSIRQSLAALKKSNPSLFYRYVRYKRLANKILIPDEKFVEQYYLNRHGVKPNLKEPRKYSEHVVKILMTPPPALKVQCADKYEVRKYVEEKAGPEILNEIYGVYDSYKGFRESLNRLPQRFALKATHGAAWNYICRDKSAIDHKELKARVNFWLKSNFYYCQRERVYRDIKPRIICEKYLEDTSGELTDYKVYCFNGKPGFMHMVTGRYSQMVYNTYDTQGNWMDIDFLRGKADRNVPLNPELPLRKLLEYSEKLSADFDYVRVDFYFVNKKFVFGELTFTPGHGNYGLPEEIDLQLGEFFNSEDA